MGLRKKFAIILTFCLGLGVTVPAKSAAITPYPLDILMAEIPPLVMAGDRKPTGLLFDIGQEIIRRIGQSPYIRFSGAPKVLPWVRAYRSLTNGPGKIMLQMVRLPEREDLFSWVRPLMTLKFAFVNIEGDPVQTFDQARERGLVSVYRKSRPEIFLRKNGFDDRSLLSGDNSQQNFKLLLYGRAKSWFALIDEAYWLTGREVPKQKIRVGAPMLTSEIWLVTSKDVPRDVRDFLKQKTEEIFSNGTYLKLRQKYGLDGGN